MPDLAKKIDYLEKEDVPVISLPKHKPVVQDLKSLTVTAERVKSIQKEEVIVPSSDIIRKVKSFKNPFDKDKKKVLWL